MSRPTSRNLTGLSSRSLSQRSCTCNCHTHNNCESEDRILTMTTAEASTNCARKRNLIEPDDDELIHNAWKRRCLAGPLRDSNADQCRKLTSVILVADETDKLHMLQMASRQLLADSKGTFQFPQGGVGVAQTKGLMVGRPMPPPPRLPTAVLTRKPKTSST